MDQFEIRIAIATRVVTLDLRSLESFSEPILEVVLLVFGAYLSDKPPCRHGLDALGEYFEAMASLPAGGSRNSRPTWRPSPPSRCLGHIRSPGQEPHTPSAPRSSEL